MADILLHLKPRVSFETYISRMRVDHTENNCLNLWIVSDNLLKGAALNAVQIAETLINKKLI